jgi:hypothetical protein
MYRTLEPGENISITVDGTTQLLSYSAGSSVEDYLLQIQSGLSANNISSTIDGHSLVITGYDPTTLQIACSPEIGGFDGFGGGYRYGFQNQEQDEELWEGAMTFKYRVEDPRLGRFFSVDPLFSKYNFNSVYAFSENRVIDAIEVEGSEHMQINNISPIGGQLSKAMECEMQDFPLKNPVDYVLYDAVVEMVSQLSPMPVEVSDIIFDQISASSDHWVNALRHGRTDFLNYSVTIFYQDGDYFIHSANAVFSIPYHTEEYNGPLDAPEIILGGIIINKLIPVIIKSVRPILVSSEKMYLERQHFAKWGRKMGYETKKAYREAAKNHAEAGQKSSDSVVYEGVYSGKGANNGRVQRIIQNEGKTTVIDKESGQIIDHYQGTLRPQNHTNIEGLQNYVPAN